MNSMSKKRKPKVEGHARVIPDDVWEHMYDKPTKKEKIINALRHGFKVFF